MPAATPALDWSSSARSSSDALASGDSNSWRTTPNAKSRSSSVPRDRSTSIPSSVAAARAAASSAVLPIPAGPSTTRNLPRPDRASSSADSIRASSSFRSRQRAPVAARLRGWAASSSGRVGASESEAVNVSRPYGALQRREARPAFPKTDIRSVTACVRAAGTHVTEKQGGRHGANAGLPPPRSMRENHRRGGAADEHNIRSRTRRRPERRDLRLRPRPAGRGL